MGIALYVLLMYIRTTQHNSHTDLYEETGKTVPGTPLDNYPQSPV